MTKNFSNGMTNTTFMMVSLSLLYLVDL